MLQPPLAVEQESQLYPVVRINHHTLKKDIILGGGLFTKKLPKAELKMAAACDDLKDKMECD